MTDDEFYLLNLARDNGCLYQNKEHDQIVTRQTKVVLTSAKFDEDLGICKVHNIPFEEFIPLFRRWLLGFRQ